MIFVTIGTDHHPFTRVFKWLRDALVQGIIASDERIVVQYGYTDGDWRGFEAYGFLSFEEMVQFFREADLVITHGSSTALLVTHYDKLPMVVPRRKHYGEHIDDHQWAFVNEARNFLPFTIVETEAEFAHALSNRDRVTARPSNFEVGGKAAIARFTLLFKELLQK